LSCWSSAFAEPPLRVLLDVHQAPLSAPGLLRAKNGLTAQHLTARILAFVCRLEVLEFRLRRRGWARPMFTKALYYPHIRLPDNAWLRRAILYWDQVSPIVPYELTDAIPAEHVSRLLEAEGLARWIRPEDALGGRAYEDVITEFRDLVSSESYLASLGPAASRTFRTRIYKDKLTYGLAEDLEELQLAKEADDFGWLDFETRTGALYMGYLAAALAHSFHLEPLTDRKSSEEGLLYSQLERRGGDEHFTSFILEGLIPAPRADVGVAEIVRFRQRNEEELLRFRRSVRSIFESIQGAKNEHEAARELDSIKDDVREQSLVLTRKLRESRVETVYSTLEVSTPTKAGLAGLFSLPLGVAIAGVSAALKIGRRLLNGRIRKDSLLAENPYTYVYRIDRELTES
jgi:Family of unknown function (DUF6236)